MNILIINDGPGLGDFISKGLFYIYKYKLENNKNNVFYYQEHGYRNLDFLNIIKNNLFTIEYVVDINKYDKVIYTCNNNKRLFLELENNFRKSIHLHTLEVFKEYIEIDKYNVSEFIIISISTISQRHKGLTDENFQNIITDLILEKNDVNFTLIGDKKTILSQKMLDMIDNNPKNLKNLLNIDKDIFDLINILYYGKLLITRNSGLLHLNGIINKPVFFLKRHYRGIFEILKNIFSKRITYYNIDDNNENEHPFYFEEWFPISNNVTKIIEYKYIENNIDIVTNILKNLI